MKFDREFFTRFQFSQEDIRRHWNSALHDLDIAQKVRIPEVRFTYSYQALIKCGIALLARVGKVKVRSRPGHHVKILEQIGEILNEPDVVVIGNAMRMKRNADLYGGGDLVGEKEAEDYLTFVQGLIARAKKIVSL